MVFVWGIEESSTMNGLTKVNSSFYADKVIKIFPYNRETRIFK